MEALEQSLYEYIIFHVEDSGLPEDFSLPGRMNQSISFADGAMDGVYIYHSPRAAFSKEETDALMQAAADASRGDFALADREFLEFTNVHSALSCMEILLDGILERAGGMDANAVFRYAIHLMAESKEKELVKIGMILMELFRDAADQDEEIKNIICLLGLSDEFTIFAVFNILLWSEGNDLLFELAKQVHGWGRIHALERLQPATPEIRTWILREGMQNRILEDYSALTVYEKADVPALLQEKDLPSEDFHAVSRVLTALFSDGPMPGIRDIPDAAGLLKSYLLAAEKQTLQLADYETIQRIYYFADTMSAEGEEGDRTALQDIAEQSVRALRTKEAESVIKEALKEGQGVELAVALGIPHYRELLTLMERDFDRCYPYAAYLMESPAYAEAVLALYRKNISLEDLEDDPREELGLGEEYAVWRKFDVLLSAMGGDCRTAGDILLRTLTSPVVRTRHLTLQCLSEWSERGKEPIAVLSPRIAEKLKAALEREPRADLRDRMQKLLSE